MTHTNRLHQLHDAGQSPWLDNLRRGWLTGGELAGWVERGIRGLTSNPSIFEKAISSGTDYDEQFGDLIGSGRSVDDVYWDLVTSDIEGALALLRPVYDASDKVDGFVSVEVAPDLARDSAGTEAAARLLHERIARPNLYVKIPGTAEGLGPIRQMIAEGRSINVTLIFSLDRYAEVMEAYIAGLEAAEGDLSAISSVASFFISRVDTEVDRRLDAIGTDAASALRGKAAVAQAQVAYQRFRDTFAGPRWDALLARGARVQRPLWASTSTKDPALPDTMYVDLLIGPDSVNTMPETTIDAFLDHGTMARTVDADPAAAEQVLANLGEVGVDLDDVGQVLEDQGVASFSKSFDELITALETKATALGAGLALVHGDLVVVDDVPGEFTERVIEAFHARPNDAFSIALSGGPTAPACYERLADDAGTQIDWWKVDVYWGDERCVPQNSPESNYHLGRESLLEQVGAVNANYPMFCDEGADPYQLHLGELGRLDVVHLGMGSDGHVASLFPGSGALDADPGRLVVMNEDPTGTNPHLRMTLTFAGIARARLVLVTVTGTSKREAMQRVIAGDKTCPATSVTADRVIWIVDPAASG